MHVDDKYKYFSTALYRANLRYSVHAKGQKALESVVELISKRYSGCIGIIFCTTTKVCPSFLCCCGLTSHVFYPGGPRDYLQVETLRHRCSPVPRTDGEQSEGNNSQYVVHREGQGYSLDKWWVYLLSKKI
jgi:hypothetical protein